MSENKIEDYSFLWNELPKDERIRLMPFELQTNLQYIAICRRKAVVAHQSHLRELDEWAKNIHKEFVKITKS